MKLLQSILLFVLVIATVTTSWMPSRRRHRHRERVSERNRLRDWLSEFRPYFSGNVRLGPELDFEWDFLGQADTQEWWEGENVCHTQNEVEEEVDGDIQHHQLMGYRSCDETETYYSCSHVIITDGKKRTTTNTMECCHGYERMTGLNGCMTELNLKSLDLTLRQLDLDDFVNGLDSVDLTTLLEHGNFTIFAPVDGSFDIPETEELEEAAMEANAVTIYPDSLDIVREARDMLSSHIVEGFLKSHTLEDEQILNTLSRHGSTIRINKYTSPVQMTTANCVLIQSTDNLATNGIVHVVDRLVPPATQTLYELISNDPQLSTFRTVVSRSGLEELLQSEDSLTLFAPTNEAFDRLGVDKLERLLQQGQCLNNVVKTHVLPNVICSDVIQGRARTKNLLNVFLYVMRNNTHVMVDESRIGIHDVMASNGVMHVIDDVIMPDSALDLMEILERDDYTEFLQLLDEAQLNDTFISLHNATLLIPSRQAIQDLPADVLQSLRDDPAKLQELLRYHVITDGKLASGQIRDGMQLNTLVDGKGIAVRHYASFPFGRSNVLTAQCARITEPGNLKGCNAIAHTIDKVLVPPVGDVLDVLSANPVYSIFVELLRETPLAEQLQGNRSYTVFAPANQYLIEADYESFRSDVEILETRLKKHIVSDILCCSGIFRSYGKSATERTLAGSDISITKSAYDVIHVNDLEVESCDQTATNGVVHGLAGVLGEEDLEPSRSPFGIPEPLWPRWMRNHPFIPNCWSVPRRNFATRYGK